MNAVQRAHRTQASQTGFRCEQALKDYWPVHPKLVVNYVTEISVVEFLDLHKCCGYYGGFLLSILEHAEVNKSKQTPCIFVPVNSISWNKSWDTEQAINQDYLGYVPPTVEWTLTEKNPEKKYPYITPPIHEAS